MSFAELATEVKVKRRCGVVHCTLASLEVLGLGTHSTAASVVRALGLRGPDEGYENTALIRITAEVARSVIEGLLTKDLAYGSDILPAEDANFLATTFLSYFPGGTFYTNGELALPGQVATWTSMTDATFDAGVLAMTNDNAGLLWVEDED